MSFTRDNSHLVWQLQVSVLSRIISPNLGSNRFCKRLPTLSSFLNLHKKVRLRQLGLLKQSVFTRNMVKVGAWVFDFAATESLKGPLVLRDLRKNQENISIQSSNKNYVMLASPYEQQSNRSKGIGKVGQSHEGLLLPKSNLIWTLEAQFMGNPCRV